MKEKLTEAIALKRNQKPEAALSILLDLQALHPKDPDINAELAGTYDSMGKESAAAPFYEAALANGLQEDRDGTMLGLGSTYRCLGQYKESMRVLDQAIAEFPDNHALKVFRALTLHNLGRSEESIEVMLNILLETTNDENIKSYERALRFYSDKLSETWE